jgi:hypothetical protein
LWWLATASDGLSARFGIEDLVFSVENCLHSGRGVALTSVGSGYQRGVCGEGLHTLSSTCADAPAPVDCAVRMARLEEVSTRGS